MGSQRPLAYWQPGWYNLDQGVTVGQSGVWWFWDDRATFLDWWQKWWKMPIDRFEGVTYFFYNDLLTGDEYHQRQANVVSISHNQLGPLARVRTNRFGTYEFEKVSGQVIEVEAEEDPGRCEDATITIEDWSVFVVLADVSHPLSD